MTISRPRVPASAAALLGWVAVALDNARTILTQPRRPGAPDVRFVHLLFDLGQTLAFGLLAWALVALVVERLRVPAGRAYAALALASIVVFERVLNDDLSSFAHRRFGALAEALLPVLCAALALTIPAATLVSRLPPRPLARLPFSAVGLALIVGNNYVLVNDYHGGHVWIATTGATLLGASLSELVLGGPAARLRLIVTGRAAWAALAAIAVLSVASIVRPPPSTVKGRLLARDTALLARPLASLHVPPDPGEAPVPPDLEAAFKPRATKEDVPPTTPGLLPRDGIVVLVTVDALRADVFSEEYASSLPNLQEFKRSSVFFSEARSFGSATHFSMAGILTGRYLSMLKQTKQVKSTNPSFKTDKLPRLQEVLGKHGVTSVVASAVQKVFTKESGLTRGFSEQFAFNDGQALRGTPEVMAHAFERLKRGPYPLFYFMHLMDPHTPYYPHDKPARWSHDAYMHEVAYVDEWIGRLRKTIRELGIADRTVLILASDHGEGFGEHGLSTHGKELYEVQVRIPILIEYPGVAARTDASYVSNIDLGPTILDFFGANTPGFYMGDSLVPLLTGKKPKHARILYMERPTSRAALFPDGIKVILSDEPRDEQVYDLRKDPDEENNLRDELLGAQRTSLAWRYVRTHQWKRGQPPQSPKPRAGL